MDIITLRFLRAMQNIEETAREMAEAFAQTRAIQSRHDRALKRIQDLLGNPANTFDSKTYSNLNSLSAKYTTQRRVLEKQLDSLGKKQQQYSDAKASFDDLFESQQWLLAERSVADLRKQEREAALARIIEATITDLCATQEINDAAEFDHRYTSNSYIPLPIDQYLNLLIALNKLLMADIDYAAEGQRYRQVSFLEIGCGHGRIMFLTRLSGLLRCSRIEGFDYNSQQVSLGRDALMLGDAIFEADALAFDYNSPDIIYSYRPFRDDSMQAELEARLALQMKPGAYLVAPSAYDLDRYSGLNRMGDGLTIWKKTG